jgi:hypothetical protein
MKKCTKCGIDKPLTAEYYHRDSSKSSGFQSHCKVCKNKQSTKSHQNNKDRILKQKAEYRQNNKEKIAKREAEYQQNNKEKIAKREAEYRIQKKAEQPACVYQIVNSVNNKIYIGETTRGEIRWNEHKQQLRGNRHPNPKLQADFNKFGEEVFKWSIIEEYPKDKDTLLLGEINTIDKLLREGKELYNLSLTIDQLKLLTEST